MATVAPISKYTLNGFRLYAIICVIAAIVLAYDGYLSKYEWSKRQNFYQEHVVDNDGVPDGTMKFNRNAPAVLLVLAVFYGFRWVSSKNNKIVAEDDQLVLPKGAVAYDSIEKIDKTHFDSKGYFVVTYKNEQGNNSQLKLNDKNYDNLPAVLEMLISKIS